MKDFLTKPLTFVTVVIMTIVGVKLLDMSTAQAAKLSGANQALVDQYVAQSVPPAGNCDVASSSCVATSFTTPGTSTALQFVSTQADGSYAFKRSGANAGIWFAASGGQMNFDVANGVNLLGLNATGNLVSSIGTFTTSIASGTAGFGCSVNNAKCVDFGTGANDYAGSDGTTVTFAGALTSAGQFAVTAGSGNVIITTDSIYAVSLRQKSGVTNAPVKMLSESTDGASAVAGATDTTTAWSTVGAKLHSFRTNGVEKAAVTVNGAVNPDFTDDSGTTGNRTVNKPAGINAFAAAGTAITITNSVVKATSLVYAQLQTADATCTFIKSVVPAAGSFVATVNAGCTGTTKIGWIVFNGN